MKKGSSTTKEREQKRVGRKFKVMYMVIDQKFGSVATEDELAQEFVEQDLGMDDTHRILQCKIR